MTDVVVDRLRLRGGDGRRLAAIAARSLPDAMDRAFADVDDATLGRLVVELDLDLTGLDDQAIAIMWADRIRAAAIAAGARTRPLPGSGAPGNGAPTTGVPGGRAAPGAVRVGPDDVDALAAAVVGWLDARGTRTAVPVAVARLADPAVAAAVVARLATRPGQLLAQTLARLAPAHLPTPDPGRDGAPADQAGPAGRDTHASRRETGTRMPPPTTGPASGRDPGARAPVAPPADGATHADRPGSAPPADAVCAAAQAVRPLLDLAARAAGPASTADLTLSTRVAGLVLLHPWLADLCRAACEAEAWHRVRDPADVRRITLAALADPQDPGLADDPLVLFLAGAGPAAASSATLAPLAARTPLIESAEGLLTRFAALLPGFERSSPGFVRTAWLVRAGLLATDRDPAQLLAETAPLDVVLPLLPYPTGLLRLPWTPPLIVRFVP